MGTGGGSVLWGKSYLGPDFVSLALGQECLTRKAQGPGELCPVQDAHSS